MILKIYAIQSSRMPIQGSLGGEFLRNQPREGTEQDREDWRITLVGRLLLLSMPLTVLLPQRSKWAKYFEKHNMWYDWKTYLLTCWIHSWRRLLVGSRSDLIFICQLLDERHNLKCLEKEKKQEFWVRPSTTCQCLKTPSSNHSVLDSERGWGKVTIKKYKWMMCHLVVSLGLDCHRQKSSTFTS